MTLTNTGLDVPTGTDAFDPDGDMRVLGLSLNPRIVVPVPNVTARNALAAALAPTPAAPLYVHRADAPVTNRLEYNEGAGWRPAAPYAGRGSGNANTFGQIAIPHGLGYLPTHCNISMGSAAALGDPLVTESAIKDYTAVVWDMTTTDIIVRFVNRSTNGWAGAGARFGVMWEAR